MHKYHRFQLGVFVVVVAVAVVAAAADVVVEFEDNEDFHEGTLTSGAFGFSSTSFRVDAVVELLP